MINTIAYLMTKSIESLSIGDIVPVEKLNGLPYYTIYDDNISYDELPMILDTGYIYYYIFRGYNESVMVLTIYNDQIINKFKAIGGRVIKS